MKLTIALFAAVLVGPSRSSSVMDAIANHDSHVRYQNDSWASSRFCYLRENTRAVANSAGQGTLDRGPRKI